MKKRECLKDGTSILIRALTYDDLNRLMEFYHSISYEERRYLKIDVTDKDAVLRRIRAVENGCADRIVALYNDNVVAEGVLEMSADSWFQGQGELRIVVARPFQRRGLGMLMVRQLYMPAVERRVEKIVARLMEPQVGARNLFRQLGFREEARLREFVRDLDGNKHDLLIMACDIGDLWKHLEELYHGSDWCRQDL